MWIYHFVYRVYTTHAYIYIMYVLPSMYTCHFHKSRDLRFLFCGCRISHFATRHAWRSQRLVSSMTSAQLQKLLQLWSRHKPIVNQWSHAWHVSTSSLFIADLSLICWFNLTFVHVCSTVLLSRSMSSLETLHSSANPGYQRFSCWRRWRGRDLLAWNYGYHTNEWLIVVNDGWSWFMLVWWWIIVMQYLILVNDIG